MCGSDDPHVDAQSLVPADALERLLLEEPQDLRPCAAGAWHGRALVCYASSGKEGNRRSPEHALYDLRSSAAQDDPRSRGTSRGGDAALMNILGQLPCAA